MNPPRTVYFDHNATSPLLHCAREAMLEVLDGPAGNPSSIHRDGVHARAILDRSRGTLAALLGARPEQVVFTAGGTESNNLAITGAARAQLTPGRSGRPVFVTSTIEHPSVLGCFDALESEGRRVHRVSPDVSGYVSAASIEEAVDGDRPALISVQLANHETGALQPLAQIAGSLAARQNAGPVVFHTDAVQGFGKVSFLVNALGVDLLSISAHKIGGPIGIGALFVRDPSLVCPVLFGGKQEAGLRPGTGSPALAAAFAAAASYRASRLATEQTRLRELRQRLWDRLRAAPLPLGVHARAQTPEVSVPNTLSLSVHGVDREALLISLDMLGFRISAGAACASGAAVPSPVLLAMGRDQETASSALRISLGSESSEEDVDRFVVALRSVLPRVLLRNDLDRDLR